MKYKKFKAMMMFEADGGTGGGTGTGDDGSTGTGTGIDDFKSSEDDGKKEETKTFSEDEVKKLVQSMVDKATNKLGNDNKLLRDELDKLRKQNMTDEERKEAERIAKETEIAEKERQLIDRENRLYAIEAIKKAGLDSGDETSLEIVDFVMDADQENIIKRVTSFKTLLDKLVTTEVEKTFKINGRKPNEGGGLGSGNEDNTATEFAKKLGTINSESGKLAKSTRDHYTQGGKR